MGQERGCTRAGLQAPTLSATSGCRCRCRAMLGVRRCGGSLFRALVARARARPRAGFCGHRIGRRQSCARSAAKASIANVRPAHASLHRSLVVPQRDRS